LNDFYKGREQTRIKHAVLRRYLSALATVVGSKYRDFAYIDCLAGPWESRDPEFSDTSFGTAISVLRGVRSTLAARSANPTMRCFFIEEEPARFAQLERFARAVQDINCRTENWDFTQHVNEIVAFCRTTRGTFPFFFIDPTGWEQIQIQTIKPILNVEPGEVLINLMTSWIKRFLSDETKNWQLLIGDQATRIAGIQGDAREDELVRAFGEQVKKAGRYPYVCTLPVLSGDKNAFHFYLVYATRSEKGVEEFKRAEKKVLDFMDKEWIANQERIRLERTSQPMLIPGALDRESRVTPFRLRNQELANTAMLKLLTEKGEVGFDQLWATAMQYSAVFERDVYVWLEEMKKNGTILPTEKKPRRGENQIIKLARP
jgi:three-Cys-motif partner protein